MASMIEMICPICGSARPGADFLKISCDICNFEYAFIRFTASRQSAKVLTDKIESARRKFKLSKIERYSEANCFTLTGDSVAYISMKDSILHIIRGDGTQEIEKNILQYSASERNSVVLYKNGKIRAFGDNSYGQCNVQELTDLTFVLCAPNCIYAVNKNGNVAIIGAVINQSIKEWKNIKSLACGAYHVLGLTKDNKVKIAGDMIDKSIIDKVSRWENVKSIAAATDCSIALFEDGTVSFAGRESDPRSETGSWKNIAAINVDSSYVIGITEDGKIKMAGSCKSYLDMGRSSAREWKDMVAVTCSRSGIAGIDDKGHLFIVGNFSGELNRVNKIWLDSVSISWEDTD